MTNLRALFRIGSKESSTVRSFHMSRGGGRRYIVGVREATEAPEAPPQANTPPPAPEVTDDGPAAPTTTDADPRLVGFGSRLTYTAHERITSEEAAARKDVSGCLIMGVAPEGTYGTDVIIEARRRVDQLVLGKGPWNYVTVSGLERTPTGTPAVLHPIKQGFGGSGLKINGADISWTNDGWNNCHHSTITNSVIRDHQYFCAFDSRNKLGPRYVVQHRDGLQPYGQGALVVDGVHFYNNAAPWPLNDAGEKVPCSWDRGTAAGDNAKGPGAASSSIMFNSAQPYTETVTVRNTRSWGGASVAFGGMYGTLVDAEGAGANSKLDIHDNIIELKAKGGVISGDVRYERYMWGGAWNSNPILQPGRLEPWRVRTADGGTRGPIRSDFVV